MSDKWKARRKEAAAAIRRQSAGRPSLGLILGSGLGDLATQIDPQVAIPFADIPHFPVSSVSGHRGRLVLGRLEGVEVAALQGRVHFYEGYSLKQVVFPVWVMVELGVKALIVTNACGGLNPAYAPGDLMLIEDHINWMGSNPLIGPNDDDLGPRFPDLTQAHTPGLLRLAEQGAAEEGVPVHRGVYAATTGPVYETRATLRLLRQLGADTVGMSTVPEVTAAAHAGMATLAISAITDMAHIQAHEGPEQVLTHQQVLAMASQITPRLSRLVRGVVRRYPAWAAAQGP